MSPRRLYWAAVWLGLALVVIKASHLGLHTIQAGDYLPSLAAISYRDVLFALGAWVVARTVLLAVHRLPRVSTAIEMTFIAFATLVVLYGVISLIAFGPLGGFPTYPLLQMVGSVWMLSSSITAFMTSRAVAGLIVVPAVYLGAVGASAWTAPASRTWRIAGMLAVWLVGGTWVAVGQHVFATDWKTHWDWRVAENPPWVLASSFWMTLDGEPTVRLSQTFSLADLTDFSPIGQRPVPKAPARRRPPNVILVVLESVAARWTSISGGDYDTTPSLKSEAAHAITFDRFYAHIGRSSNSLASILLSLYTKLDFMDYTEEYKAKARRSLATVLGERGYRTAFMTSSDMAWADWDAFVPTHGFVEVHDDRDLPCEKPVNSWGVADECLVDGMQAFIEANRTRPFFLMAWTQQTHHPYEPTPGAPELDLVREPEVPDDYDLNRYLNVLHETDRQLSRVFESVRAAGLADDTIIVVTGDHGQAFGYPHNSYLQGRNVYEEDVRVPLLITYPRRITTGSRPLTIGGLVDLAPTIADLAGVAPSPDWQGRSLFDKKRSPRAYFYVAQDEFRLGVREANWKYILDLRTGVEELYDLDHDPIEWKNLASDQPERCAQLRQHLAAWTDSNHRQYSQ